MTIDAPRRARTAVPVLIAVIVAIAGGCAPNITDSDIRSMPVAEVRSLTLRQAEKPDARVITLIDPRAKARFDAGHLPGARNLKLPQVPERSGIDPSIAAFKYIVVYGTDPGSAAARAMTKRLMRVGYSGVKLFPGGTSEWVASGFALEVSPVVPLVEPMPADPADSDAGGPVPD